MQVRQRASNADLLKHLRQGLLPGCGSACCAIRSRCLDVGWVVRCSGDGTRDRCSIILAKLRRARGWRSHPQAGLSQAATVSYLYLAICRWHGTTAECPTCRRLKTKIQLGPQQLSVEVVLTANESLALVSSWSTTRDASCAALSKQRPAGVGASGTASLTSLDGLWMAGMLKLDEAHALQTSRGIITRFAFASAPRGGGGEARRSV